VKCSGFDITILQILIEVTTVLMEEMDVVLLEKLKALLRLKYLKLIKLSGKMKNIEKDNTILELNHIKGMQRK
jgi:hypothetical protein